MEMYQTKRRCDKMKAYIDLENVLNVLIMQKDFKTCNDESNEGPR